MARNDDRIDYLMGDAADSTDADGSLDAFDRGELDELRALLADPSLWEEPSPGLGDAVVAAIAGAVDTVPGPVTTASAPRPAPATARRQRGLSFLAAAALGAAAATAVAFAVVRVGDDSTPSQSADTHIALVGTDLLPGAAGVADITSTPSGVRIHLDVPSLPRREGTEFYEAWLKNEDGTLLIPVGTFHTGDDVTLWAGVSVDDYPILTVTREVAAGPKDPLQGSSGEVVVSGRINP